MHSNGAVHHSDGDNAELAEIVADARSLTLAEARVQAGRVRMLARAAEFQ